MNAKSLLMSAAILGAAACSDDKANSCPHPANYTPNIAPSNFPTSTRIDNQYFPLTPGRSFTYRDADGNITVVAVTSDTKTIAGITCVVVHDFTKTPAGELFEDTYDWYAQDKDGNVWYMGEDTKLYQNGSVISTQGSWLTGANGAKPGIIMEGHPQVGDSYRQEYLCGSAEDKADVLSLTETITVPYGTFNNCLKTKDHSDLEPGKAENKYFSPGLGQVSAVDIVTSGTAPHEDLISVTGP